MGALFATDFWPEDFWPEGFFGDPALGVVDDAGFWTPNFWLDTFWPNEFWANDPGSIADGTLAQTFAGVSAAIVGDYNAASAGPRNGILNASLGPLTGSLGGTIAYITDFDLEVGISVNWQLFDLPVVDGSIAVTLEDLSGAFSGIAWDLSYTDGFIGPTETLWPPSFWDARLFPEGYWPKTAGLDDLTAAFEGTFGGAPGQFVGELVGALDALTATFEGRFAQREQFNGLVVATLAGVSGALTGDTERPQFSGAAAATLDGISGAIVGIVTPAGAFNGRLRSTLSGVSGQLRGTYDVPLREGEVNATLEGVTAYGWGLAVPDGAKVGTVRVTLTGVAMLASGTHLTPRMRPKESIVTVTEIDWKTLCDQHNLGLADEYDYEFSNGRRFKQA